MRAELIADQSATRRMQIGRAPVHWPWLLVTAAWLLLLLATLTNQRYLIDHHWLMDQSGLPWLIAALIFLACWQVMTVAMMLPSSMPMVYLVTYATRKRQHRYTQLAAFVVGYLVVWTGFALLALVVDTGVHWLEDSWLWLATYPWFIGAITFAIAGIFQFSPLKARCLTVCRSPLRCLLGYYRAGDGGAWRLGLRHGLWCLGCTWALMLIMFGVGIASLTGMAVLAGVMVIETTPLGGQRMRPVLGVTCLTLAVLWFAHPAWLLRSVAGPSLAAPANAVAVGQAQYSGGYVIMLQASPAKPGEITLVVTLRNDQGAGIADAHVVVETTMLDMGMGQQQVRLQPITGGALGTYGGQGELPMVGHWELVVWVQPAHNGQPIQAVFLLTMA
jgi:predicted metal-binding membrane protein